ncbi:capsid protein [Crucivirus-309]|nr:capsid protein [Crucivirus-309]
MVSTRSRRRSSGSSSSSSAFPLPVNPYVPPTQRSTQQGLTEAVAEMSAETQTQPSSDGYISYYTGEPLTASGAVGPQNWVDPVTYRALRKKFTKKRKRTTTKKRSTRRSSRSYGNSGRSLSGMGPIVITGRGGYWGDKFGEGASAAWKSLKRVTPEGTFSRLGRAAGGAMFGKPGASVGNWLGGGVSGILGFGDYAVKKNDLMVLDEGVPVPTFQNMNDGVIVCHREYIGDIGQTVNFTNTAFPIQPGDATTFPWLHQIASQFEQYEILGMLFQFRSTSSDFGSTANMALGTVIMATEYDSVDASFGSKLEMENAQYSMSGKPSHDILHPVECDPGVVGPMGLKYVRTGPLPSGKDNRLYDHGNFQIATTGMPVGSGTIGELWVTYKIAFYKPQFNHGVDIKSDFFFHSSADNSNMFGTVPIAVSNSSLGCTISGNTITFPKTAVVGQVYMIAYQCNGGAAVTSAGGCIYTGCAAINRQASLPGAGTVTRYMENQYIRITNVSPTAAITVVWSAMTLPTAITDVRTVITQLDSDLLSQLG